MSDADTKARRLRSESTPDANRAARAGNLARWNAQGHRYRDIDQAVEKFKADLEAQAGATPSPATVALSAAATASYTGVLLIQNRLLAARGRYSKIESLLGLLPTLVGSLQRTMRLLAGHPNDQADADVPTIEQYIASHTRPELADK